MSLSDCQGFKDWIRFKDFFEDGSKAISIRARLIWQVREGRVFRKPITSRSYVRSANQE